ncbi:MAG: shikimate dehydrogenase [Hyphomicrobiales bacterium]|nr:shikimate dehydrogenase [Hyphomicrobiales bacterium]
MSEAKNACVIGWPIGHSRSPLVHNYWIAQHGLDAHYDKEAVRPEDFEAFVRGLAARGYRGASVTVPHKEAALALADEADATARAIGAANTLWLEDGRLHATNTDAYGFMTHLDLSAPGWDAPPRPAAVLGAGGAARAVLAGLAERGLPEIRLLNRTRARAEALAGRLGSRVEVGDWDERDAVLEGCGLLVNTTTLGMAGAPALEIDLARLPDDAVVADIVYTPLETPLLAAARAGGLGTVDGLGMLLHQGALGFERWFGVRPEVTEELRALVVADLGEAAC